MNRDEKIKILMNLEAGLIPLSSLKNKSAVIIYTATGSYRLSNSNKVMTKKEIDVYTQGMNTVLFLPDNGKDKINNGG